MRILGVSGSLRAGSHNTALLRAAAQVLPPGVELELYDELELVPPYNEDRDTQEPPEAVVRLRERIDGADAVLFATPEYNGSIPGQLKNAVDWASRPKGESVLWGKPVAVIGASPTPFGAVWAQQEVRKVLGAVGARVIGEELPVIRVHERFDAQCRLTGAEVCERLADVLSALAGAVEHPHEAVAA
jgi:chromate reductase